MWRALLLTPPLRGAALALLLAVAGTQAAAQPACPAPDRPPIPFDPAQPAVVIDAAERIGADGGVERVQLPDSASPGAGEAFVERRYRVPIDATAQSLYLSAVFGHLRVSLNGHKLLDTISEPLNPEPRSSKRQRLLALPPCLLLAAGNSVDITVRSARHAGISKVALGGYDTLHDLRNDKTFWMSSAPAVVAAMISFLGLSVLLIWARRRTETIYLHFGVASVAWGVHTAWSVSSTALLPAPHETVWWTALYAFVVAMLAIFSVRFAGYRPQRTERALLWGAALAPLWLYLGVAIGAASGFSTALRLGMVVVAFGGLAAVAISAVRRRSIDAALLVVAGLAAAGLGARDWWVFTFGDDNMPVQLAPFAGLPFVLLVTWFLIDRFVRTNESLESLNRDLESRVASQSKALTSALEHMRVARDGAEKANLGKTGFLAAASHDLRQPIHALGLYMGSLRQRPLEAGAREIVERMEGSVGALESLLNALLDISRIDAGVLVPQPRAFDLGALLHRLADEFAPEAAERGLRFTARIGGAAPAYAQADPMLVERVLRNLVANAVKYTHSGGVLVTCRLRGDSGPAPHWRVEVWDTGPGIAPEEQERVFDEFYQAGNPERDRRGGLGLGLSIVRRLSELMNLPLALHSRLGHGSRFALDLPAYLQPLCAIAFTDERATLPALVIAVIDDDAEVRDAMRSLLHSWHCDVVDGADADEVLKAVSAGHPPPRAVVADLRLLGGRDGVAEVARLRAAFGAALPALLVSGDSAPERVRMMQDSGLPWLAKPVSPARLRSWLSRAAHLARRVEEPI
jgi:signal transduction histidine kinase/CheY-like chemotaxis protein